MTTPTVTPSKAKTWVALAGSLLSVVVPLVVSVQDYLPAPWPAVIGGVIAGLTALGVYKAPYTPPGAVVVADPEIESIEAGKPPGNTPPPVAGGYQNPWRPKP